MRVELNVDMDEHSYNVQLDCDRSIPIAQLIANAVTSVQAMIEDTQGF